MTLKQALKIVGGLSEPSKMPCYSYNTPATKCITGSKLAKIAGSVCSKCYAFRGNYMWGIVQRALMRRYKSLTHPMWVKAMTTAIGGLESSGYFRWADSGDLRGVWHLNKICQVAKNLPKIKFWLPTREYGMVSDYIQAGNKIPDNLNIRLSAFMIDGEPPTAIAKRLGLTTGGVSTDDSFTCPAPLQGHKCLSCRKCWDKHIANINYKKH
jgi:hypothetical protein